MVRRALIPLVLVACTAEEPPIAAPTLDTLPTAERLADESMARLPAEEMALGWIETVFGHALLRLGDRTEDPRWHEAAESWMVPRVEEFTADPPRTFDSSDSMSPASVASFLMIRDPQLDLVPITDAAHAYLGEANRTAEGAITHWYDHNFLPNDEIWVDSLFMFGMFLLGEHERTGDRAHLDAFVEQYVLFSQLCRDPDTQLYHHAYKDATQENIPADDTFWARGNSWVLIAGVEALGQLEPGDEAYETLQPLVIAHAEAVIETQADDGLWHTVMNQPRGDDPANYTETSAAALLAYGLLRGTETVLAPEDALPAVHRAVEGVTGRLEERSDGTLALQGTSFGTNPSTYEEYIAVDVGRNLPLGVASAVLLLTEAHGLEEVW